MKTGNSARSVEILKWSLRCIEYAEQRVLPVGTRKPDRCVVGDRRWRPLNACGPANFCAPSRNLFDLCCALYGKPLVVFKPSRIPVLFICPVPFIPTCSSLPLRSTYICWCCTIWVSHSDNTARSVTFIVTPKIIREHFQVVLLFVSILFLLKNPQKKTPRTVKSKNIFP